MLVFKINYKGKYEDDIFVTGETMKEVKANAEIAMKERNWERKNCWSEKIECKEVDHD